MFAEESVLAVSPTDKEFRLSCRLALISHSLSPLSRTTAVLRVVYIIHRNHFFVPFFLSFSVLFTGTFFRFLCIIDVTDTAILSFYLLRFGGGVIVGVWLVNTFDCWRRSYEDAYILSAI